MCSALSQQGEVRNVHTRHKDSFFSPLSPSESTNNLFPVHLNTRHSPAFISSASKYVLTWNNRRHFHSLNSYSKIPVMLLKPKWVQEKKKKKTWTKKKKIPVLHSCGRVITDGGLEWGVSCSFGLRRRHQIHCGLKKEWICQLNKLRGLNAGQMWATPSESAEIVWWESSPEALPLVDASQADTLKTTRLFLASLDFPWRGRRWVGSRRVCRCSFVSRMLFFPLFVWLRMSVKEGYLWILNSSLSHLLAQV